MYTSANHVYRVKLKQNAKPIPVLSKEDIEASKANVAKYLRKNK